jgi:hypothetical protein
MANRATTHLPNQPEVLRPDERPPAKERQDAPRAGRTGLGARAERPSDKTSAKTANAPQPGRGGNGPSPSSKSLRGVAAKSPGSPEGGSTKGESGPEPARKAAG